jgi:hypothetical protein
MKYHYVRCTVDSMRSLSQLEKVPFLDENLDFGVFLSSIGKKLTEERTSSSNFDSIFLC